MAINPECGRGPAQIPLKPISSKNSSKGSHTGPVDYWVLYEKSLEDNGQ